MKWLVPILVGSSLAACSPQAATPRVDAESVRVSLPAVDGRPGAGYFTLTTNQERSRLIGIDSPQAGRIELHRTITEGDRSRMERIAEARFGKDEPLRFEPGGAHAMLFELDPSLRPGSKVTLTFRFEKAAPLTIEAEVTGPGGAAHGGH